MTKKKEQLIELADGSFGVRRYATLYWFDGRLRKPSPWSRGYPRAEVGSVEGAAREVMTGRAFQVQCVDRVKGKIVWTVRRGERIPGTSLYEAKPSRGDAEAPSRRKER